VAIAACESEQPSYPGQISTTSDGGKKLILVASYSIKAMAMGFRVWADVDAETPGTVEMTGAWHMRCDGKFVIPPPGNPYPESMPSLDIGDGWETAPGFHAPPGHYSVKVAIPSKAASLGKSFDAGMSIPDATTNTYEPPGDCVLIADTKAQLEELTRQHVDALDLLVRGLPASPQMTPLIALAERASAALAGGDRSAATDAVETLLNFLAPTSPEATALDREARVALALLTQQEPAT